MWTAVTRRTVNSMMAARVLKELAGLLKLKIGTALLMAATACRLIHPRRSRTGSPRPPYRRGTRHIGFPEQYGRLAGS